MRRTKPGPFVLWSAKNPQPYQANYDIELDFNGKLYSADRMKWLYVYESKNTSMGFYRLRQCD
jgi:hypothetical protein